MSDTTDPERCSLITNALRTCARTRIHPSSIGAGRAFVLSFQLKGKVCFVFAL